MWEGVLGKDYNNIPSTSESPDGPNNKRNDDFHLFITPEKSLHTDIPSVESVAEINELINLEGNSEEESPRALENWFPVQSKDYSHTDMISFKSDPDDNAITKSLGTREDSNIITRTTVRVPSVSPPSHALSINDPKYKYESFDVDGRSKGQLVGQSQLSKLQITGGCNDEHEANSPTIEGPDSDHIFFMIEEGKNEEKDKENQNGPEASLAHLMSEPYLRREPFSVSALMSLETLDQPNDNYNTKKSDLNVTVNVDQEEFGISVVKIKATDDMDESEEVRDVDKCSSDRHYEKLNKSDENPQYAELFPPNMQDILDEMPDSAENMLELSRVEMETRSEPDGGYTGDSYDDDISDYM